MKKFIIVVLMVVSTFSYGKVKSLASQNESNAEKNDHVFAISHTYVPVLIDGVWWIYEYDEDGKLINVYLDEE